MTDRFTEAELHETAARAIHEIERWGPRGVTLVTHREIEAMACLLVLFIDHLAGSGPAPTSPTPEETPE